jgi:uroporphyrin-III C-methyltransferase
LTRRHTARRVQFITGADVKGELPQDLYWDALADPHAMTAVYMGKKTFPALAAKLIALGLSPETPALLAESVGQADQRLIRTTVKKLAEQLTQENVTATAVILYGALAADDP